MTILKLCTPDGCKQNTRTIIVIYNNAQYQNLRVGRFKYYRNTFTEQQLFGFIKCVTLSIYYHGNNNWCNRCVVYNSCLVGPTEVETGYVVVDVVDQTGWRDLADVDKKDPLCTR